MAKKVKHYDISEIMNTIICGDTIEELKKIEDESVDLIFADPPYFMQTEGELHRTDGSKSNGVEDGTNSYQGGTQSSIEPGTGKLNPSKYQQLFFEKYYRLK